MRNSSWIVIPRADSYDVALRGGDGRLSIFTTHPTKRAADEERRRRIRRNGKHGERISRTNHNHNGGREMAAKKKNTKQAKKPRKAAAKKPAKKSTKKAPKKGTRSAQALALRREGYSFGEIADELGYGGEYPSSAAFTMVKAGLRAEYGDDAKAIRQEQERMNEVAKAARAAEAAEAEEE